MTIPNIELTWDNKYNVIHFRKNHYKKIFYKKKDIYMWRILFKHAWYLYDIQEIPEYNENI